MRFEKFTNRLQQALSDAQSLAMGKDHTAIAGIHILSTLLEEFNVTFGSYLGVRS